jgi:hypothetical protein
MRVANRSRRSAPALCRVTFPLVKETQYNLVSSWWHSSLVTDLRTSVHFCYVEEVLSETGVPDEGIFTLTRT